MANVSAQEQLMLELVNRARMDPLAEAARFGMSLNEGIAAGSISTTPKQALAMNDALVLAANRHSEYMHINDHFSHTEIGGRIGFSGVNPSDRLIAAGYNNATSQGENISRYGVFPGPVNLATAIIAQHEGLFRSTDGHRQNLMADVWREVGIGQEHGSFLDSGTQYDSSLVTQNFAYRNNGQYFLTGVTYQDTVVNDDFYTVGEGTGNVSVLVNGGFADVTSSAGGYEAALTNGTYNVAIGVANVVLTIASRNVKLDFVNGNQLWTDSSLTLVSGAGDVRLLGATNASLAGTNNGEQLVGNRGNNVLIGNGGNDTLFGRDGNDTLLGGNGNDTLYGEAGVDRLEGGADNDQINGGALGDYIDGGAGYDFARYDFATTGVQARLDNAALNSGEAAGDTMYNFEGLVGGQKGDILVGNNLAIGNQIYGLGGPDTIRGLGGPDSFFGGLGNDTIHTGTGTDTVYVQAADRVKGEIDRIVDFTDGQDQLRFQGISAASATISDSQGGTLIKLNVPGGGQFTVFLYNISAVASSDQIFFV